LDEDGNGYAADQEGIAEANLFNALESLHKSTGDGGKTTRFAGHNGRLNYAKGCPDRSCSIAGVKTACKYFIQRNFDDTAIYVGDTYTTCTEVGRMKYSITSADIGDGGMIEFSFPPHNDADIIAVFYCDTLLLGAKPSDAVDSELASLNVASDYIMGLQRTAFNKALNAGFIFYRDCNDTNCKELNTEIVEKLRRIDKRNADDQRPPKYYPPFPNPQKGGPPSPQGPGVFR